jgi:hypothetical protein
MRYRTDPPDLHPYAELVVTVAELVITAAQRELVFAIAQRELVVAAAQFELAVAHPEHLVAVAFAVDDRVPDRRLDQVRQPRQPVQGTRLLRQHRMPAGPRHQPQEGSPGS